MQGAYSKYLKGKPIKDGVKDFCKEHGFEFPETLNDLMESMSTVKEKYKAEKISSVKDQNFEAGARYRDLEKQIIDKMEFFGNLDIDPYAKLWD